MKKKTRSRSRLKKNQGAGAAKKFTGSPTLLTPMTFEIYHGGFKKCVRDYIFCIVSSL